MTQTRGPIAAPESLELEDTQEIMEFIVWPL